jgi:hypothetical protein
MNVLPEVRDCVDDSHNHQCVESGSRLREKMRKCAKTDQIKTRDHKGDFKEW